MTTGTTIRGGLLPTQRYYQGSPNGSYLCGTKSTKTWAGGDGLPSKQVKGKERTYTTIRNGRTVTKKFRERPLKRKASGIPHSYTMSFVEESKPVTSISVVLRDTATGWEPGPPYVWTYSNTNVIDGFDRSGWPTPDPFPFSDNDQLKLVNKLKSKIHGSDFNMSVFLGEAHQTLKMLGDTVIKVARAYHAFRKGDIVGAVATLGNSRKVFGSPKKRQVVGNNWLELQYGWLPLLGDAKSLAELLAQQLNFPFKQVYRVKSQDLMNPTFAGKGLSRSSRFNVQRHIVSRQIIATISEPPSVAQMSGILDPELVAWELTPFSFASDWLIPIGDYLEARAFSSHLVGTFVTTDREIVDVGGWVGLSDTLSSPGNTLVTTGDSGGAFYRSISLNRTVNSALQVPMPQVKSLNKAASWQHCANAIALLASGAKGIFPKSWG